MSYLIFIYNDYGVSEISVDHMKRTLSDLYTLSTIKLVNGREVQEGQLIIDEKEKFDIESRLFCLGGGFDLGYISSFGDKGCEEIRRFVTAGGHYLGICAGAYFASSMVLFDRSGPLEVVGERKLKFFTGSTIGPCNIRFKYKSEDETKAVKVKIDGISKDYYLYLNGGCYFEEQLINQNNNHEIIGRYDEANNDPDLIEGLNEKPALVALCLGKGSILLSGVHFEFDADKLDLDNHNIKANVYPKLNANEIDSKLHSNQFLIRYLFNKVFLFE